MFSVSWTKKYFIFCSVFFLVLSLAYGEDSNDNSAIKFDLRQIYEKYPSLRTNARLEIMEKAATEVLGQARAKVLMNFISKKTDDFQNLRNSLTPSFSNAKNIRKAVVSGQSITGMVSAAILAKSGYEVDVYDIRDKYTRNIQWAGRQSLVDELASIDQGLADKFLEQVAKPLDRGSIHLTSDGEKKHYEQKGLRKGDPTKIPSNGAKMMEEPSIMNMEAKNFEIVLKEYLDTLPNVRRHAGTIELGTPDANGNYSVIGHGHPDIVVIAEGGGSKTRDILGVASVPTSPSRLQIAGVVHIEGGGVMAKHWRRESGDILLTGTMGRKGSGKTWVVADIDPAKIVPDKQFGTDPTSKKYIIEKQRLIDDEFRRVASDAIEVPIEVVRKVKIEGAVEGKPVESFLLQQRISAKATAGHNVVAFGDAVGNNHWSVGGGMQTGAVGHGERLKNLLHDIDRGVPRDTALQKYSDGVFSDTRAWGEIGINDFYPNLNRETAKKAYNEGIQLWREGKVDSPERALALMMPKGTSSKTIKSLKLDCNGIIRRVLGEL
ncbi:MAG: hypothetical protein ACXVCP_09245 [Bdellovibrio sp.]